MRNTIKTCKSRDSRQRTATIVTRGTFVSPASRSSNLSRHVAHIFTVDPFSEARSKQALISLAKLKELHLLWREKRLKMRRNLSKRRRFQPRCSFRRRGRSASNWREVSWRRPCTATASRWGFPSRWFRGPLGLKSSPRRSHRLPER